MKQLGLRAEARQVGDAQRGEEHRARGREPRLRSQAGDLDAVAVRPGAAWSTASDMTGGDLTSDQRPVRSQVQGQGHVPQRAARHGRARCCSPTARTRRTPTSTPRLTAVREDREGGQGRPDPRASPATSYTTPAAEGRLVRRARVVGRRGAAAGGQPERSSSPRPRRASWCSPTPCRFRWALRKPCTAQKMIDFVYQPEIQAQITGLRELRAAGQGRARRSSRRTIRRSPRTR